MPTMSVRMAPGIHREVRDRAARSQISMNSLIVRYIVEGLIRDELAAESARIKTDPDAITDITTRLRGGLP